MKLAEWLMAKALIGVLSSGSIATKAKDIGNHFDKLLDKKFEKESEAIQLVCVQHILIPLCREILKENMIPYKKMLDAESQLVSRELSKNNLHI